MMKQIKRMLFLCIGIMVFATVSGTVSNPDNVRQIPEKFAETFEAAFKTAFENVGGVSKYEEEILNHFNAFTACKENLLHHFEEHQAFYSTNRARSADIDEKIKAEVDKFLGQTPVLPNNVLKVLPVNVPKKDVKGVFGTILSTTRSDIVVKKLSKAGINKTNLADVQREVAFATMFYFQYPELAPIVYGYTEDEGSYYIYMEKFDMDLFEYSKEVISENKAYSKSQSTKKGVTSPLKLEKPSMTVMELLSRETEFFEKLGDALKEAGINHSDIRNPNILVKVNGDSLKFAIGDFGLATFTGLYYRTHQQILLCADGNEPFEDYDHRLIINPFQKLAYVFSETSDDITLYNTITNAIKHNDKYSLGISLYELYLQEEMSKRLWTQLNEEETTEAVKIVKMELVTYVTQHLQNFQFPTEFKKYLLKKATNFGKEARDWYFDFIRIGISTFEAFDKIALKSTIDDDDEKVKQYIQAGKEADQYFEAHEKVKQYIITNVVDVWKNFKELTTTK